MRVAQIFAVVWAVLMLFHAASLAEQKRNYHPYAISAMTAEDPRNWKHPLSHIEIQGWVAYVAKEGDGDIHIRLCDSSKPPAAMDPKHCIVAEIMPTLAPKGFVKPKKGMHLLVRGIGRYDGENPGHHWWECHPIEEMEVLH